MSCVGSGIYRQMTSLLGLVQIWVSKLGAASGRPEVMPMSDWLKLEAALLNWQSSVEAVLQNFRTQPEDIKDEKNPDTTYVSEVLGIWINWSLGCQMWIF